MTAAAPQPVAVGTLIGPYEVVGWLGAGGMGDVYRARDSRLDREVAIKRIPQAFASDEGRLQRFAQEARAAGQLNHPNILAVYDVGVHAGAPYIVSELLEGESLQARLRDGPLPARKAVQYARQIADGLAAAHEKGMVHRDLKPDNLFITSDGRVKILDFGIAKLTRPGSDGGPAGLHTDTAPGIVMGTAGYMSPEQVRGEPVDHRSDLFAFGATLHEMLTGRPAFTRASAADRMAAVLKDEPAGPLPPATPVALARIVSRCLEKAMDARFQSARDLAFAIGCLTESSTATLVDDVRAPLRRRLLPWAAAGAIGFAIAMAVVVWASWRTANPQAPVRLSVELSRGVSLAPLNAQFGDAAVLSADGSTIAFVGRNIDEEQPHLYVRRLNQLQATPLSGTDDALVPFFSPDGRWIGFFADMKLKKVAVTGGAPVSLADAPSNRGAAWSEDNTIVFAPHQLPGTRLLRVSANGGESEPLAPLADGEAIQLWPQVLPGGAAVLYTGSRSAGAYNDADIVVQPLPAGPRKVIQRGGYHARYLPSGHLVYIHDGTLFAAPFDLDRLELTGQSLPALEGVRSNSITGGAQFSVSSGGTLIYLPGPSVGIGIPLLWMDHEGLTTSVGMDRANWFNPRFSPDGRRIAMSIRNGRSAIELFDLARDSLTRLTTDIAQEDMPVWSPEGGGLAFASTRADKSTSNIYWKRMDGSGETLRLTESPNVQRPGSWHPSGRFLAFEETTQNTSIDLMILPLAGDDASGWRPGKPSALLNGPAIEAEPMFSPDGRWLAYVSTESGHAEVYVRPFPGPGGRWQISTGGGNNPTWSRTGPELFYGADGQIMVVSYSVAGGILVAQKPRPWSEKRYTTRGPQRMFALHPDGQRMVLAPASTPPGGTTPDKLMFVFNFFDELRRITTSGGR